MKEDEIVIWLQTEQRELQARYNELLDKKRKLKGYDCRGVWIAVQCGCGHDYKTPMWIRKNGICKNCGKKIWTFQKIKDV